MTEAAGSPVFSLLKTTVWTYKSKLLSKCDSLLQCLCPPLYWHQFSALKYSERNKTNRNEIDMDTKRFMWSDVHVPKEAKKLHRRTRGSFSVLCERHAHRAALLYTPMHKSTKKGGNPMNEVYLRGKLVSMYEPIAPASQPKHLVYQLRVSHKTAQQ